MEEGAQSLCKPKRRTPSPAWCTQEWVPGEVQGLLLSHKLGKLDLDHGCYYVSVFVFLLFASHFSSFLKTFSKKVKRDTDLPSEQCWGSDQILFCSRM